jgi:hypothetical protein
MGAAPGPCGRILALQTSALVGMRGPRTHDGHAGVGKGHVDGPERSLGRRDRGLHLQRARDAARWSPDLSHVWLSAAEACCEQLLSLIPEACLCTSCTFTPIQIKGGSHPRQPGHQNHAALSGQAGHAQRSRAAWCCSSHHLTAPAARARSVWPRGLLLISSLKREVGERGCATQRGGARGWACLGPVAHIRSCREHAPADARLLGQLAQLLDSGIQLCAAARDEAHAAVARDVRPAARLRLRGTVPVRLMRALTEAEGPPDGCKLLSRQLSRSPRCLFKRSCNRNSAAVLGNAARRAWLMVCRDQLTWPAPSQCLRSRPCRRHVVRPGLSSLLRAAQPQQCWAAVQVHGCRTARPVICLSRGRQLRSTTSYDSERAYTTCLTCGLTH